MRLFRLAIHYGHDLKVARLVLHYCIHQAKEMGQPKGQDLEEAESVQLPSAASSLTLQLVKMMLRSINHVYLVNQLNFYGKQILGSLFFCIIFVV